MDWEGHIYIFRDRYTCIHIHTCTHTHIGACVCKTVAIKIEYKFNRVLQFLGAFGGTKQKKGNDVKYIPTSKIKIFL